MSDLINRLTDDDIETIRIHLSAIKEDLCNQHRWNEAKEYEALIDRLTAQSEIIRCKDCKYWIPYDWMFSEVWRSKNIEDYPEDEIGCNFCDVAMKANDFCSRGERSEVME